MPKNILIVNDEEDVAEVTKDMLEAAGYNAAVVSGGEEAFRWLANNSCDLLLLDLLLEGMQGEEICKRLKSDKSLRSIAVVLLSANPVDEEKTLKETGADAFISIPYDPVELMNKIKSLTA